MKRTPIVLLPFLLLTLFLMPAQTTAASGKEYHVSVNGEDGNDGSLSHMLQTISAAAVLAQPGDTITVHEGVYRERITPPRGGESDENRIVYQAVPGDKVEIKGSEEVSGWKKVRHDTWKVTLPNRFFGNYNPYDDLIHGDWFDAKDREHHTGAVYLNGEWLIEAAALKEVMEPAGTAPEWINQAATAADVRLWYAKVAPDSTTVWAQFKNVNPNKERVEINVRRAVFYPEQPGMNYITVRGFIMRHAATQWAPPTAEQIGLIGTHWSKGWIIENNTISHSVCSGIALGKHGDEFDNTSADTAEGYVKTIERAIEHGWSKENIGHHSIRNNTISHCEQTGIVGSMGAAFSTITGNTIHDIHVRKLFTGCEMAGIKLHAAIDVEVRNNHIYRSCRGLWLDWMAQGARVSGNLFHDNPYEDLFVEVNHGPFVVDNNIFLSPISIRNASRGGAYVHNLMLGEIRIHAYDARMTPYHTAHSTALAGMHDNPCGDDRYYNNIFVKHANLHAYDKKCLPVFMAGNVFLAGARASKHEEEPLILKRCDPGVLLVEKTDGFYLESVPDNKWAEKNTQQTVTTALLGRALVSDLPYENRDATPLTIDTDFFGNKRKTVNPFPGPFKFSGEGKQVMNVWHTRTSR